VAAIKHALLIAVLALWLLSFTSPALTLLAQQYPYPRQIQRM
jgi:hypothetical protein